MRTDKNHAGNVSPPRNTILDLGKRFVRSTASWKIVPTDRGKERKRRYVISDYSISVPPPLFSRRPCPSKVDEPLNRWLLFPDRALTRVAFLRSLMYRRWEAILSRS